MALVCFDIDLDDDVEVCEENLTFINDEEEDRISCL